jgi:hypothetical protein
MNLIRFKPALVSFLVLSLSQMAGAVELSDSLADPAALDRAVQGWTVISGSGESTQREWQPPGTVFGRKPERVLATTKDGRLSRVDVLYLTATAATMEKFEKEAAMMKFAQVKVIEARLRVTGVPGIGDASMPHDTRFMTWNTSKVAVRLLFEPHKRVWLSIVPLAAPTPEPTAPPPAIAAKQVPPANAREAAQAKVKELPNGDVLIPDDSLPEMPEAGDDDPLALCLCQFLVKYYGWKADPAEAMKGTERLDDFEKHEAALKKLIKEAGSRMKMVEKFDFNDVKRELAKGRVVAVVYAHNDLREDAWYDYAKAYDKDPQTPPPDAKDPEVRKKWQDLESASYHSSLIIQGYNTKRDELITRVMGFSSKVYSPRLQIEEMKVSAYQVFTFSPD